MSAVTDAISDVGDAVGDVVSSVGDAVEDVGDFIVEDIVNPVVDAVDKTVQAALDDPVNTAIRVAAFAVGGPAGLAIANGTIALAQGESFEDAAMTAGKSYVIAQAGSYAGAEAGAYAGEAGASAETANIIKGATSGATKAGLGGGDAVAGALSGGVTAGSMEAAKALSDADFAEWARQQAENDYNNAYSPTEQDVLAADPSIEMNFPLSTPTDATGPGYYNELTGEFIEDPNGGLQAPLTDASGTGTVGDTPEGSPNSGTGPLSTNLSAPTDETPPEGYQGLGVKNIGSVLNTVAKSIIGSALGSSGSVQPNQNLSGLAPLSNASPLAFVAPEFLDTSSKYLGGQSSPLATTSSTGAKLQELKQLYPSITPEMAQEMADKSESQTQTTDPSMQTTKFMADGGLADSSKTVESLFKDPTFTKIASPNLLPAAPLMSNPMKLNPLRHLHESLTNRQRTAGGLAAGGLPQKYADALPKGHKPEFITGLTGYYASGKGTGQSDDIDAMLHDGDYVADADLVAALGDGSSKAGAEALEKFRRQIPHQQHAEGGPAVAAKIADGEYVFPASFVTAIGQGDNKAGAKILDKMREAIRAHKRSAPTTKIPPKAKSPLDYLKMVKG